jgi:hypothetical protein
LSGVQAALLVHVTHCPFEQTWSVAQNVPLSAGAPVSTHASAVPAQLLSVPL